jgi:quinol monooxygenase YgiN
MLTILVTMTVKPEDVAEFEATLEALMPKLRETETETLKFDYYRVNKQDGVYRILEIYSSREALDFHVNNPATLDQRTIFKRLLIGQTEVLSLIPVGGK